MKMIIRLLATAVLPFALVQCGGDGGEALTAASAPTVLSNLTTVVLGKLPQSATAVALPMAGASTAAAKPVLAAATDCETATPAVGVDNDHDNIALTKTSTFNCTSQTVGGSVYTRQGSYEVTDLDDTVAGMFGGMRVDFNVESYDTITTATGDESRYSYVGFWEYKRSGNALVSTSNFSGRNAYFSATSEYDIDYAYTYSWSWIHTPTDINAPFTTGTEDFEGRYTLNGKFVHEDHSGNHSPVTGTWSVRYYSKNLSYDSTCAKWWRSGSLYIDDSNGNLYEIRYACASAALYVNGVASTVWTP